MGTTRPGNSGYITMRKEYSVGFNYKTDVADSNDIMRVRNKIQEYAHTLGFRKPELTVLTTATSEVCRLFVNTFDKVSTETYNIEDTDTTGIAIHISGTLPNNQKSEDPDAVEITSELDQELKKIKNIFCQYELSVHNKNIIVLNLKKTIPVSRETKFPKNI